MIDYYFLICNAFAGAPNKSDDEILKSSIAEWSEVQSTVVVIRNVY